MQHFGIAVERKKSKIPVIIYNTSHVWNKVIEEKLPDNFLKKLPEDNLTLEYSMQTK